MHRGLLYIMTFVLLLTLFSCSLEDPYLDEANLTPHNSQTEIGKTESTSYFGVAYTDEEFLNPLTTKNKINLEMYSLVFEGLFELDEKFEPVNLLCDSFQMSGNSYSLHIKKGVSFSDGSALTADDVVFSLNLAMQADSYYSSRMSNIVRLTAQGDNVVEITLSRPNANLPRILDIPIIKKGTDKSKIAIGTGQYMFSPDESSKGYCLTVNKNFHLSKSAPFEKIELIKISTVDELIFAFESGDISVACFDPTSSTSIQFRGDYQSREYPTTVLQYIGFNTRKAPFTGADVRRAVSCSIDRNAIIEQDYARLAEATCLPVHPITTAYNKDAEKNLSYSIENATYLFNQAGYADTDGDGKLENSKSNELEFSLLVNTDNKSRVSTAHRIKEQLSKVGVTVTVIERTWEDYSSALRSGDFHAYLAEINLSADFDVSSLIRTGGSLNYGGYSSSDTDLVIDAFNSSPLADSGENKRFMNNISQQAPIVPILFKKNSHITHKQGFESVFFTQRNIFYHFYDWKQVH